MRVVAFGHPTLRKIAVDIDKDYPKLDELIENMFATMYHTEGVGLAAPQINRSIRLFIIDAAPFKEQHPETEGFKEVFINAQIIETDGDDWSFSEGCLSIPNINEEVQRPTRVLLRYENVEGEKIEKWFDGIIARIIQHEYDHLEGKLFIDHISSLRKVLLKRKIKSIIDGTVKTDHRMIFAPKKRK